MAARNVTSTLKPARGVLPATTSVTLALVSQTHAANAMCSVDAFRATPNKVLISTLKATLVSHSVLVPTFSRMVNAYKTANLACTSLKKDAGAAKWKAAGLVSARTHALSVNLE